MKIKRTANAGVLLTLDGVRLLLDGVCGEVTPYLPTPEAEYRNLLLEKPDAVAFTHTHADHYDAAFVSDYLQNAAGPILGPADIPFSSQESLAIGDVQISQIPTHHLGKTEAVGHHSFLIKGSRCVWFTGDASPLQWKKLPDLPKPDILIVPYAYAIGSGWQICAQLGAEAVVLLHLPKREQDPYGLWNAVEQTVGQGTGPKLYLPDLGETLEI